MRSGSNSRAAGSTTCSTSPQNTSSPAPAGTGRLSEKPAPGAGPHVLERRRCRDRTATGGCSRRAPRATPWKIAFVPLPWCTSQSSTSTRSAPSESSAWRAATATFENRQKPIARSGSAWWPGGRSAEKPVGAPPASSASTSAHAPPAACSAASQEPGLRGVSRSKAPPRALSSRTASTCSLRVDREQLRELGRRAPRGAPSRASRGRRVAARSRGSDPAARGARTRCRARARRDGGR